MRRHKRNQRVVDSFCYLYGMLRFAWVVCFAFCNGEYHIVCVDFIYSSRGRLERDRGFTNPLSLSNTSPDPLGNPLRRENVGCRGGQGYRIPVSGAGRSSPLRYIVWVLGVRAETVRISENHARHMSFVFHWWWMDCSFLRLRGVLP